ncbi:hypothetical protein E2542_SST17167 [Spatholobus suberectus]|nr:hypothetical protein E2542_SST17167 [Spatholobus suberectus]
MVSLNPYRHGQKKEKGSKIQSKVTNKLQMGTTFTMHPLSLRFYLTKATRDWGGEGLDLWIKRGYYTYSDGDGSYGFTQGCRGDVGPLGMMVGVGAPLGVTGTRGTVLNPGAGAVAGGEGSAGDGGEGWGNGGAGGDGDVVGG